MTNPIDYWYQKYLQEKKRADNLQSASKEMGNRIYFNPHTALYSHERQTEDDIEYICKNIVDEMLGVAEDHAYFAGSEAMREQMIEKAVEWLKAYIHYDDFGGNMEWLVPFENDECMIQHFKTYMEE